MLSWLRNVNCTVRGAVGACTSGHGSVAKSTEAGPERLPARSNACTVAV